MAFTYKWDADTGQFGVTETTDTSTTTSVYEPKVGRVDSPISTTTTRTATDTTNSTTTESMTDYIRHPEQELINAAFGTTETTPDAVGGSQILSAGGDPIAGAISALGSGTAGGAGDIDLFASVKRQVTATNQTTQTYGGGAYDPDLTDFSSMFTGEAAEAFNSPVNEAKRAITDALPEGDWSMTGLVLAGVAGLAAIALTR